MIIKKLPKMLNIFKKTEAGTMPAYLRLRIFFAITLVAAVGILFYKGMVPGGKISCAHKFDSDNKFIKKLIPDTRVGQMENGQQAITGDPVYFSLHTPRKFNKALVTLKYKNAAELPLIQAGIMTDKQMWRHDLKPVENMVLDQLLLVWDATREGDTLLLQRKISTSSEEIKKYSSIEEFKNNLPPLSEVAVYNYDLEAEYLLADYEGGGDSKVISTPLRGGYKFYTYLKDEEMNFSFDFDDLNQNKGSDDIDIFVYYQKDLIDSKSIKDELSVNDDRAVTKREPVVLKYSNLPEGAYTIEVKASDDVVTRKISSSLSKMAFANKLWIYNSKDAEMELYTDSAEIKFMTTDPSKLQTVKAGDKESAVAETYKQFGLKDKGGVKKIVLEKGGLIISGDGVFSFDEGGVISPGVRRADSNFSPNDESVNYIIADYNSPLEAEDWKEVKIEFDLSGAYREKEPSLFSLGWSGEYNFIISVPGLMADDGIDDRIIIDEINIDLEGATLFDKIKALLKKDE